MGIIGKWRWQKNVSTCNRSVESIQSEEDKKIDKSEKSQQPMRQLQKV